jgi:hypothetical protein
MPELPRNSAENDLAATVPARYAIRWATNQPGIFVSTE